MTFTFKQLSDLADAYRGLREQKLPFKLSLIIAKDLPVLEKEIEFYVEQEREFANTYLEKNEDGTFVQTEPNMFKIKEDLLAECQEARAALDGFTAEINLHKVPVNLIENLEFTPAQLESMAEVIEEE